MLFTTTGFQSGAIKYAKAHGIALVSIIEGAAT
jgi:restriction system protein